MAVKETKKISEALTIKRARTIPLKNAIIIASEYVGISLYYDFNDSGKTDIYDEDTNELVGFITENEKYCIIDDPEIKAGGDQISSAKYYLNHKGGQNLSNFDIARFLVGKYALESEEFRSNINDLVDSDVILTLSLAQFLETNFETPGYLVDSLMPDQGITMIHGAPGSYKTFFYIYIISCILNGTPVLGQYKTKPVNVLIINTDDAKAVLRDRLKAIMPKQRKKNLQVWCTDFKIESHGDELREYIKKHDIGLVVFDTLRQMHDGDENDSLAVSKVMNTIKSAIEPNNCAAIVVHHDAKDQHRNDINAASGSIVAVGDCICTIHLKRRGSDTLQLSQGKNKIGGYFSSTILRFALDEENGNVFSVINQLPSSTSPEQISQLIEEFYQANPNPNLKKDEVVKQLAEKTGLSKSKLEKEFDKLATSGFITFEHGAHGVKNYHLAESSQETGSPSAPIDITAAPTGA